MQINANSNLFTTDEKKGIKKDPEVGINGKNYKISDSGKEGTVSQKFADSLNKLSESNSANKDPDLSFVSIASNKTEKAIASDLMKNKFSEFDPDGSGENATRGVSTAPKDPVKKSSGFDPSSLKFGNAEASKQNANPSNILEDAKKMLQDSSDSNSIKKSNYGGDRANIGPKREIASSKFEAVNQEFKEALTSAESKQKVKEMLKDIPDSAIITKSSYGDEKTEISQKREIPSSKFNPVDDKLKKFLDKLSSDPELLEKAKQSENKKIQDFIKNNNL